MKYTHLEFQYNYCFGGTALDYVTGFNSLNFNTTIVSVEPILHEALTKYDAYFNTTIVSVELIPLLLFAKVDNSFQYNYCFGGTFFLILLC